jgi:hypothetical protein
MEMIVKKAEVYATENGMRGPFRVSVKVASFGFSVEVIELEGKLRSAHMTFLRDGSPSMFERTSR